MGGPEIVVVVVLAVVLFGGSRIAELGRGLGRGISSFREGLAGSAADEADEPGLARASVPERASRDRA